MGVWQLVSPASSSQYHQLALSHKSQILIMFQKVEIPDFG